LPPVSGVCTWAAPHKRYFNPCAERTSGGLQRTAFGKPLRTEPPFVTGEAGGGFNFKLEIVYDGRN
jgi:hypothetical protein